jgi:long-chain acyl-CoA synthetase
MLFSTKDPQITRAAELHDPPAKGQPYSVPIPGTQTADRTAIYRHWRFTDKPLFDSLVRRSARHTKALRTV